MTLDDDEAAKLAALILSRTRREGDCHIWTRGKTGGWCGGNSYGRLNFNGLGWLAHRAAYAAAHKIVPPAGVLVCHRCDRTLCVNPAHLFLGTTKQNSEDMKAKGRHRYGERSCRAKLTQAQVDEIRRLRVGRTLKELGKQFGVSEMTISRIARGLRWKASCS